MDGNKPSHGLWKATAPPTVSLTADTQAEVPIVSEG